MSLEQVNEAVTGSSAPPPVDTATAIGQAAKRLDEIANDMAKAKEEEGDRYESLKKEQAALASGLSELQTKATAERRESEVTEAIETAKAAMDYATSYRTPSKASLIGTGRSLAPTMSGYDKGSFLYGVHEANARDAERQVAGKAILAALRNERTRDFERAADVPEAKAVLDVVMGSGWADAKAFGYQEAWGESILGKSTLGTTDATGGWVIPNAIVDEFITPARIDNIYRSICTIVPGVTAPAVDIPFRSAIRARATIKAFGQTKENLDLAYNGYTATMYTLARIYDIGNQFLRQSRGAAENDVLSELAAAFAQGEAWYIREGTGSSEPFGYTAALTNGPAAFRTTFTASATTLAGSMATAIAAAAGALAGRGVSGRDLAAVLSATSYWTMLSQGTDSAGFFFNPAQGPTAINAAAGTLISPWGIPVYPDADADLESTAAVIDNLVVGNWRKFKVYFGQDYRVDSSDQAGTRWDTNLTGFRGEEEMGFDARPAVYAGHFQMITDITP